MGSSLRSSPIRPPGTFSREREKGLISSANPPLRRHLARPALRRAQDVQACASQESWRLWPLLRRRGKWQFERGNGTSALAVGQYRPAAVELRHLGHEAQA